MKKTILSTADVARMFSVTETTVKRWADEGTLRCHKTPGGHRKFEIRHVIEFAEKNNYDPVGTLEIVGGERISSALQVAVLSRDFPALVREYVERALSPSRTDLYDFLFYLYEHRVQLWEIFDLVVSPGMWEIGERWARGDIGVNHEHKASYETLEALAKLQSHILIRPGGTHAALLGALGEEQHEIGLRCAAYVFESEGWRTHYLGARTPHDALVASIQELHPNVVCLSVSLPEHLPALRQRLDAVIQAGRGAGARIVIGGRAADRGALPEADDVSLVTGTKDLLEYLHRFFGSGPGQHGGNGRPKKRNAGR